MWDNNTSNVFISYLMEGTGRPITGLDFASLYPHLIMTYNFSPEYIISKETCNGSIEKMAKLAEQAVKDGYNLHKIIFQYGSRTVLGYSVRHDNKDGLFGVYPTLLKELYDKRSILKKPKIYYEMLVEHFEKINDDISKNNKIVEFLSDDDNKHIFDNADTWDELILLEPAFSYIKSSKPKKCECAADNFKFKISPIEYLTIHDAAEFICKKLNIFDKDDKSMEKIINVLTSHLGLDENTNYNEEKFTFDDLELSFSYFDSKQKALKIMMNCLYGESGSKISPFYILALAGGITTAGQYNLRLVENACKEFNCGVQYGDSVVGDTPVLIGNNNYNNYVNIEDLFNRNSYTKELDKEVFYPNNLNVWSDKGFTRIKKVIRHKTNKKLYRILSHTGCVDVTEDHSLLNKDGEKIKPSKCEVGIELLHKDLPLMIHTKDMISKEEAWVFGLFMAGRFRKSTAKKSKRFLSTDRNFESKIKDELSSFKSNISNNNMDLLKKTHKSMKKSFYCKNYKITTSRLYPTGNPKGYKKFIVEEFRNMFYYNKTKIVPTIILESSEIIRQSFFEGYCAGVDLKEVYTNPSDRKEDSSSFVLFEPPPTSFKNGSSFKQKDATKEFTMKGKIGLATMYQLCNSLGYQCSIAYTEILDSKFRTNKLDTFRLLVDLNDRNFESLKSPVQSSFKSTAKNKIKKIIPLPESEDYVYDLETENHHFSAGIGRMVVSNTDSVYITMPENSFENLDNQYFSGKLSKLEYYNNLVNITFTEIKKINKQINDKLIIDNGTKFLRLNYEEVLFPVVLLSKKKYYGLPHISIPNFSSDKKPFIRGLEIKKRGTSEVLKKVYISKILIKSLEINNKKELMELVYDAVHYFYENNWAIDDFIRTAVYKPKTLEEITEGKGHKKVLEFAGRMRERGEDIKPYERFKYIIIKKYPIVHDYRGRKRELRIGERMELLNNVKKFNLDIDKDYYMNSNIITQLARVLVYRNEFYISSLDDSDKEIKKANEKMVKKAVKHIIEFIKNKKFYNNYIDVGIIKKAIFKKAESIIINKFKQMNNTNKEYTDYIFKDWKLDSVKAFTDLYEKTEKISIKKTANYGPDFIKFAISLEKKKSKETRKNTIEKISQLKDLYRTNSEHVKKYLIFKKSNTNKAEGDFREMFKSLHIITTQYRESINDISYILEKLLKPILDQFYNPTKDIDIIEKYKGMSYDGLLLSIGEKSIIPHEFLDDISEDAIYELMKNSDVLNIIKKILNIKYDLLSTLNIYNQIISIQEAIITYNDKKNNMNVILYDNPNILQNHKNELINMTCNGLKNINFDV